MDTGKPLVSIIMPIYNASSYLMRALESIQKQTYTNLEALLINDGSTDGSGQLCQEMSQADTRFRYFERHNSGVADSREYGLQNAKGDYIIHFDSDDWAETNMIEDMVEQAQEMNADVVIADFYVNRQGYPQKYSKQMPNSLEPHHVLHELFRHLHGSCWNKLVKRECLNSQHAHFYQGINYCEDKLFWSQILKNNDIKIAYINKAYYHYDYSISSNSITRNYTRKTFEIRKKYIEKLQEILVEDEWDSDILLAKFEVKYEAYLSNILSRNELKHLYPESNRMAKDMHYSLVNRILFALACNGLKNIAIFLYRLKTC